MKNIDKMIKCRAIYLESIAALIGDEIQLDDNFNILLNSFLETYLESYAELFNLIYYFDFDEKNELVIKEEPEWQELLNKYLTYFRTGNSKEIIKMYDDIGFDNANKIGILAQKFYMYIAVLNDMNNKKIRS